MEIEFVGYCEVCREKIFPYEDMTVDTTPEGRARLVHTKCLSKLDGEKNDKKDVSKVQQEDVD